MFNIGDAFWWGGRFGVVAGLVSAYVNVSDHHVHFAAACTFLLSHLL